jgi:hypothetical protein
VKFRSAFRTDEELAQAQDEWSTQISKLTRKQIDDGFQKLKTLMQNSKDHDWPNIAATIRLCKENTNPAHKLFVPALVDKEEQKKRKKIGIKNIHEIKKHLRSTRNGENTL